LWHSFSEDGGLQWSRAAQVTGLSEAKAPAVTVDPGRRPHILAVDGGRLLDWLWDGERWVAGDNLDVPFTGDGALGAAASPASQLVALYAGEIPGDTAVVESEGSSLFSMDRPLEIPPALLAPQPTVMPTPEPTGTPAPTATPQPTPTLVFSTEQEAELIGAIPGLPAESSQILLGVVPAGLIVLLAFIVGVRIVRKR
jgi:hypothetical protein